MFSPLIHLPIITYDFHLTAEPGETRVSFVSYMHKNEYDDAELQCEPMGKSLFTWELGGGLGHMMQILPMARELALRGHQVICALEPPVERPYRIIADLERMLSEPGFGDAARHFADRYADFDPIGENEQMIARLESLVR